MKENKLGVIWNLNPIELDVLGKKFEGQLKKEAKELILEKVELSDNDFPFFIDELEYRLILSKNHPYIEEFSNLPLIKIFNNLVEEYNQ